MKKAISFLFVLFTVHLIFASSNVISVSFSPYSFQKISTNSGVNDGSSYGFGAKIGYKYKLSESFEVGVDSSYSRFSYDKLYNNEKYNVLSFLAKVGYSVELFKPVFLFMDLGAGIDVRMLHGESKVNPSIGAYIGFDFSVLTNVLITTGADIKLGIQSNSKDFAVVTHIGAEIAF